MEILDIPSAVTSFIARPGRVPELNLQPDDGQLPLPPRAERGRRGVLDGR
jgi:hypothetical protein